MKDYHAPGYAHAYYQRTIERRRQVAVASKRRKWARWCIKAVLLELAQPAG